jgi:hypothetical protein
VLALEVIAERHEEPECQGLVQELVHPACSRLCAAWSAEIYRRY